MSNVNRRFFYVRHSTLFWGIVGLALGIRIGFVLLLGSCMDSAGVTSIDASSYHSLAQNLVERHIFTSPVDPPYNTQLPETFRPPLTPLLLAAIYWIAGVNIIWGRIGFAIISAFSTGLTYLLGERLFGRTAAVLAGLISCVYPFFLLLVHLPLTENLSIFLTLALMTLIYCYHPNYHAFLWAGSIGVIFGLTLLNKAANIVVFPCLTLWALWELRAPLKKRIAALGLIIIVAGIVMLPWIIRNYRIIGMVVPVNSNGGWTFYLGNNPHTEQNLRALEQGTANGWTPPQEVFLPLADLAFTETKAREQRAVRLGLEFIHEHPGKFVEFAFRKVKIFWTAYPHILDNVSWYPVAVFSVLGIWWSLASWKQYHLLYLLILSSMSIPLVFTSMPRFRAPLLPFFIMFASFALITIGRKWYADRN